MTPEQTLLAKIACADALQHHIDLHDLNADDSPGVFRLLGKTLDDIEAFALQASAGE